MKFTIKKEVEFEAKTLKVSAGVRYWENAKVNGVEDEDGALIPFRVGDYWCPVIDIESGIIIDWPKGVTASVHYKICDDGTYTIQDGNGVLIFEREGYVPNCMCPKENGYGDYIVMEINAQGKIDGWEPDFSDFTTEED